MLPARPWAPGVGNAVPPVTPLLEAAEELQEVLEGVLKEVLEGAEQLHNQVQEIKILRLQAEVNHRRWLRRRQRAAALEAAAEVQRARWAVEKEQRSMGQEDRQSAATRRRKAEQEQNEEDRIRKSWRAFLDYGVRWKYVKEALEMARAREEALEKAREEALEMARARDAPPRTPTKSAGEGQGGGSGDSLFKASSDEA